MLSSFPNMHRTCVAIGIEAAGTRISEHAVCTDSHPANGTHLTSAPESRSVIATRSTRRAGGDSRLA